MPREVAKSARVPGLSWFEERLKKLVNAGWAETVNRFLPLAETSLNAVRAFWMAKRDVPTLSGVRAVDPVEAIKQTITATNMLQNVAGIDAEFVTETAEEAFSEALMPGIAGAMRAEAAIKMGFEPWTQPHQMLDPVATALADQLTGIIWPNLVHAKIEQYWQGMAQFWQKYSDMLYTIEALVNPFAALLSSDALLQSVGQVYANIMDAVNALYTRVTEAYTIYLGVKSLYERGYVGREEYDNATLFILSTLESVRLNIEQLEDELYNLTETLRWFIDDEEARYVQTAVEVVQDQLTAKIAEELSVYLPTLFAGRVIKPRGGIRIRTYVGGLPSEHDAII